MGGSAGPGILRSGRLPLLLKGLPGCGCPPATEGAPRHHPGAAHREGWGWRHPDLGEPRARSVWEHLNCRRSAAFPGPGPVRGVPNSSTCLDFEKKQREKDRLEGPSGGLVSKQQQRSRVDAGESSGGPGPVTSSWLELCPARGQDPRGRPAHSQPRPQPGRLPGTFQTKGGLTPAAPPPTPLPAHPPQLRPPKPARQSL